MNTPPTVGPVAGPASLPVGTRILGVDPGLEITGYGVIEVASRGPIVVEAGIVRSAPNRQRIEMACRVHLLYDGILEVIDQLRPVVVVVEQLYAHYQHPRTAILMAHARGVIFLAGAQRGLPVVSYNATRIKKTVTGHGRAPKDQVQRTVQRELALEQWPEPPDIADALAAALCHYYQVRLPGRGGA